MLILEKLKAFLGGWPGDGAASRHGSKPSSGINPDNFILTFEDSRDQEEPR